MKEQFFGEVLIELARRGDGRRESGAFLLAERQPTDQSADTGAPLMVVAIAYYDDLDPSCLTGGITFSGEGYTALNARCRRDRVRVVGDIHTHPRRGVAQSHIDSAHPMAALDGHVALIAPNYARGPITLDTLGAHVYRHNGWTSYFGAEVATVFTLMTSPVAPSWMARLRASAVSIRRLLTRRSAR